jgi:hypothetical protein
VTAGAGQPVRLTPHPLQRAGAFALARLARVGHPDEIGEPELARAVGVMHDDLARTLAAQDAKDANGFWLGASYLFWPNSRLPNTTNRKKLSVQERRELLRQWRTLPSPDAAIGVPCSLCGQAASGFYGKVDVALGASANYRNTTPRGHEGLALCRGCVASFHALPYGCAISGGRAAVVHSWDDKFLSQMVRRQVHRMRQDASVGAGRFSDARPYARQVAALRLIRAYDDEISGGLDLMVFSNSNKEQALDVHSMGQPMANWARDIRYQPDMREGWRYLKRAHRTAMVPGLSGLARNLFDRPHLVTARAAGYLRELAADLHVPPAEARALAVICLNYATEVLGMEKSDAEEIRALARNIAGETSQGGSEFGEFVFAARKPGDLKKWLRSRAISQARYSRKPEIFISERQWRLLFDADLDGFLNRDLLLICALEEVHALNPEWRTDDPGKRSEFDDDFKDVEDEGWDE